MSALGAMLGGPGGPGGPGGGPPPSIQIGGPQGGPAAGPAGESDSKPDGDWESDLQDAKTALQNLIRDGQDHPEVALIAKCLQIVTGILAKRQTGAESALGVTPAHKAMSRSY